MGHAIRTYRGPVIGGLLLFAASCFWAWFYWDNILERDRHQKLRIAAGLAAALTPLFDPELGKNGTDEAAAVALVKRRLELAPPVRYAMLLAGQRQLAVIGRIPEELPDPARAGLTDDGKLWVAAVSLGPEPERGSPSFRGFPASTKAPPLNNWVWAQDPASQPLRLVLGMSTEVDPHLVQKAIPEILFALLVGWAGIIALLLAWYRSIRSRNLTLALESERRERERLEEMNLAAAGLAHETKNPLGIILGLAQRIERDARCGSEIREAAGYIIDAADRASARVSDFLAFARVPNPRLESTRADLLLANVVAALKADFDDAGVHVKVLVPELSISCAPGMMEQVLVNLLLNSLHASDAGTTVTLCLKPRGATAVLEVEDQGHGIPPELLPDLFKPYVSGHPDGHGLGLAIVKRIVDQHGWTIEIQSTVSGGTRVIIDGIPVTDVRE